MKILRIVPLLDFGGVERRVKHTFVGFQAQGSVEFNVLVLGSGGKVSAELISLGFRPLILDRKIKIPNFKLIYDLYFILKKQKPDVVHTSGSEANFHGLFAAKLAGVPVRIGEEIGFPNHDWRWVLVFKFIYHISTKVIGISESVKAKIVGLGEVEDKKVEVIYNPVSVNDIENIFFINKSIVNFSEVDSSSIIKRNDSSFVVVSVCRLVPVKNLSLLINSVAVLINKYPDVDIMLWIVGDGPLRSDFTELSLTLGIEANVNFLGFRDDVPKILRQCDVFVLPSFSEGFSTALVEAMLCQLPCVVTKIGGPSEIVEHGVSGFLIDPYCFESLFSVLEKLMNMDIEQRREFGLAAQESASKFSIDSYISNLVKVYSDH